MDYPRILQKDFLWALATLCRLERMPFSPRAILREYPPPYNLFNLQAAAERLGFLSGLKAIKSEELAHCSFPCIAVVQPSAEPDLTGGEALHGNVVNVVAPDFSAGSEAEPVAQLAILLNADHAAISFVQPDSPTPQKVAPDAFDARFAGMVIQFVRQTATADDPDAVQATRNFGFRWFVPELLKHRRIWRDVLLASLAIQLMGLTTPLFTQVVIDKVIVHHTRSTLVALGIGLLIFMLFSAAMTWTRQYLVLHTGNRVDAVLGTEVFEHLLRLPPRYYEHRPTGVVVARIHGVETVRQFVSSAAITLFLDCPFLLVFLAIMFYYSWLLSIVTLVVLLLIVGMSIVVSPIFRARLNEQFLLGARNQAFLTEYVAGMETVKSLQMEPQLRERFGNYLASYLAAGFKTRQLANTYNVVANTLDQILVLLILCVGAWMAMNDPGFTIGMLVAYQMFAGRLSQPLLRLVGLWQQFQQARIAVERLGDVMNAPAEPYSLVPSRSGGGRGKIEIVDLS